MFFCPRCNHPLSQAKSEQGFLWACGLCLGRMITLQVLRRIVERSSLNTVWQTMLESSVPAEIKCPSCRRLMTEALEESKGTSLDACVSCQVIWLDSGEIDQMPAAPEEPASRPSAVTPEPEAAWQWIPGILGMPIELEEASFHRQPRATWALALCILGFTLGCSFNLSAAVERFGLIPAEMSRLGGPDCIIGPMNCD